MLLEILSPITDETTDESLAALARASIETPRPILCASAHVHGRSGHAQLLDVRGLMIENHRYEESAWDWIRDLLETGYHDDSDPRTVHVSYYALDRDLLREQAQAWYDANRDGIVALKQLEPIT